MFVREKPVNSSRRFSRRGMQQRRARKSDGCLTRATMTESSNLRAEVSVLIRLRRKGGASAPPQITGHSSRALAPEAALLQGLKAPSTVLCSSAGPKSPCENSLCVSFRGAEGDEESCTALKNTQSEIPRFARNDTPTEVLTRALKPRPSKTRMIAFIKTPKRYRLPDCAS